MSIKMTIERRTMEQGLKEPPKFCVWLSESDMKFIVDEKTFAQCIPGTVMELVPYAERCTRCLRPLGANVVGDGDGTGQRFAHPKCFEMNLQLPEVDE